MRVLANLGLIATISLISLAATTAYADEQTRRATDQRNIINTDRVVVDPGRIALPDDNGRIVRPPPSTAIDIGKFRDVLGEATRITRYNPATNETEEIHGRAAATLNVGEYISVASDNLQLAPMSRATGQEYTPMSGVILTKFADGSINQLRVDHFTEGFAWKKDNSAFQASIYIKASNVDDPNAGDSLVNPIPVRITGNELLDSPPEVRITQLGFLGEQEVVMRSDARSSPVSITMRHAVDPDGQKIIDIEVDRPQLTLSANPAAIAGFGIESTEITVSSNGNLPPGFALILDSSAGSLDPKTVTIDSNGVATARLWSAGVGPATLSVLEDRFQLNNVTVTYLKPLGFLIACALGAALGATSFFLWQRSRAKDKPSIWSWCAAFVLGIGITIAAFAGFDIPKMLDLPAGRSGLVVVFATGFLAALLSNTIIGALGGSGGKPEEEVE